MQVASKSLYKKLRTKNAKLPTFRLSSVVYNQLHELSFIKSPLVALVISLQGQPDSRNSLAQRFSISSYSTASSTEGPNGNLYLPRRKVSFSRAHFTTAIQSFCTVHGSVIIVEIMSFFSIDAGVNAGMTPCNTRAKSFIRPTRFS